MSGFAETIEIRAGRPAWLIPLIGAGLLLASCAVLISDLHWWVQAALVTGVALGTFREWRAARCNGVAAGVEALWLTAAGDWSLVLETGELQRAELLHRQGFVTRRLVGLTLRRVGAEQRRNSRVRVWLTPGMLEPAHWRRLQVCLRNP